MLTYKKRIDQVQFLVEVKKNILCDIFKGKSGERRYYKKVILSI